VVVDPTDAIVAYPEGEQRGRNFKFLRRLTTES